MGIMIVVGVITIVVVGFSIYNWRKTIRLSRTCSNEVKDDIATVALTVLSIFLLGVYISMSVTIFFNKHPLKTTRYEVQSRRATLVAALDKENGLAMNQEEIKEFNLGKYKYETYKDNFWIGWFQNSKWESVDYIEIEVKKWTKLQAELVYLDY